MTMEQLLQEIDRLKPDELQQVQTYIEQRRREAAEGRASALMQAFDKLREGLTEQQLDDIEQSINFNHIKTPTK